MSSPLPAPQRPADGDCRSNAGQIGQAVHGPPGSCRSDAGQIDSGRPWPGRGGCRSNAGQIAASEWSRTDDEDRNRRPTMDLRPTSGRELRYTLTIVLADVRRTLTVPALLEALNQIGRPAAGRPENTRSERSEERRGGERGVKDGGAGGGAT